MNALRNNPNATVSGVTGAVALIVIWTAGVAGLEMDPGTAAAFSTVLITVVLAIGRRSAR